MWTLSSTGNSLFASGETSIFLLNEFGDQTVTRLMYGRNGITNTGVYMQYGPFYENYKSLCTNYACTLKLSMIRPVVTDDNRKIPFIEYQVVIGGG